MRTSQFPLFTVKETPADAELKSHQFMLRAGMIRKLASGVYNWLPLGLKVLKKVESIIREEMNKSGALEILMPNIQPAELWQESGRWEKYGSELLRINDRHKRDFCFGPTHEEVVTALLRDELKSYKQLPLNVYQIQTKFRDEIRPRFGVMRAREFIMKDAYSFHKDKASLEQTYQVMFETYSNIFTRLGLEFRAVLADTGSIGGSFSHEFQVLAESGEDSIAVSDQSPYAANVERAEALKPQGPRPAATGSMAEVATPNKYSIKDICEFLNVEPQQTIKTLLVEGVNETPIALVLRGDHELNPLKAEKLPLVKAPLTFINEAEVPAIVGCNVGSLGPVGLDIPIIVDYDAAHLANFVCGANKNDKHLQNVNWGRDLAEPETADLRMVCSGDTSPDGKGKLKIIRGIEVGHIFQLGDKYSKAMNANVLDENGKSLTLQMGCYGIGVSRIVAAAIEQNNDEYGIIWPEAMAPFDVVLIPLNAKKSDAVKEKSETLYHELAKAGISVLMDDRDDRAGVLFADADLIGIPHRIVVSERSLEQNSVEYRHRRNKENIIIPLEDIIGHIR